MHQGLDLLADIVAVSHKGTLYSRGWYTGRWGLRFAAHEHWGFHIVSRGLVWLGVDEEEDSSPLRLEEGDIVLVATSHTLLSERGVPAIPFHAETALALMVPEAQAETGLLCGAYQVGAQHARHPMFDNLPPLIHLRRGERDEAIDALVGVLESELDREAPGARTIARRLVDALLLYILRHWLDRACPNQLGWLRALRDPVLARALALIHGAYGDDWTLERLARASGTSRASLARHFTAEVGVPPIQYLTTRRLEKARLLLQSSTHSLDEIAAEVGYSTGFALSRAFKRHFGKPPSQLQAMFHGGDGSHAAEARPRSG
ncbi:MAG: AraC family transcriptional regulator [Myxococcota bacterium]